jgi:hypothetical protein
MLVVRVESDILNNYPYQVLSMDEIPRRSRPSMTGSKPEKSCHFTDSISALCLFVAKLSIREDDLQQLFMVKTVDRPVRVMVGQEYIHVNA